MREIRLTIPFSMPPPAPRASTTCMIRIAIYSLPLISDTLDIFGIDRAKAGGGMSSGSNQRIHLLPVAFILQFRLQQLLSTLGHASEPRGLARANSLSPWLAEQLQQP